MLAQAGIFNPLFLVGPFLLLGLLCVPVFFLVHNRNRRIRQIEIKAKLKLEEELQDLAAGVATNVSDV